MPYCAVSHLIPTLTLTDSKHKDLIVYNQEWDTSDTACVSYYNKNLLITGLLKTHCIYCDFGTYLCYDAAHILLIFQENKYARF